jgi:hypothetical protein
VGEDGDRGADGELGAEVGGQVAVELDGDEAMGAGSQNGGEGAAAGADFNDGAMGDVAESVGDGRLGGGADEEILTEPGLLGAQHHL